MTSRDPQKPVSYRRPDSVPDPAPGAAAGAPPDLVGAAPAPYRPTDPPPVPRERFVKGTHIKYLDAANVEWSVVEIEVDRSAVPGARGPRCLLFSRKDCIRRVWSYPADWRSLDATALADLSWQR